jgi:hypothetical protein
MRAGRRRRDAFAAAELLVRKGDTETWKVLESVSEREAVEEAGASASVLCLPKCHRIVQAAGHCCSANAGSLTCFSEQ